MKNKKYDFKNVDTYVFAAASVSAIIATYITATNTKIMAASPHFFLPGFISTFVNLIFFGVLAYATQAVITKQKIPNMIKLLYYVISLMAILLAINAVIVVATTAHLYR
jgi:hypothetical protein